MSRFHNKIYQQKVNNSEYKAPAEIIEQIEKSGCFVSSSHGKYMQVFSRLNGKTVYMGPLHKYVKAESKKFKNKNTRDVTLGNLK